tara:strand:+ start:320 stop:580 length:261 start_codon:yes stop_codon:yes gene_type:complete
MRTKKQNAKFDKAITEQIKAHMEDESNDTYLYLRMNNEQEDVYLFTGSERHNLSIALFTMATEIPEFYECLKNAYLVATEQKNKLN